MWSTGMYEEYCTVKRGEMVVQLEDPWASSATAVACGRFATGELGFARSGRDVLEEACLVRAKLRFAEVWILYCAEPAPQARPERVTVSVSCEATGYPQLSYGEPWIVAESENEPELLS